MDETDVKVIFATQDHAAQILHCLAVAFEPYRDQYTPQAYEDTVLNGHTILERMKDMDIIVAMIDDKVVGTIATKVTTHQVGASVLLDKGGKIEGFRDGFYAVTDSEGHIRGMAVFPEYQGTNVADVLIKTAERTLKIRECSRITLDTTEPLIRAQRFYEKHGYKPTGQTRDFYGMNLIELAKELR